MMTLISSQRVELWTFMNLDCPRLSRQQAFVQKCALCANEKKLIMQKIMSHKHCFEMSARYSSDIATDQILGISRFSFENLLRWRLMFGSLNVSREAFCRTSQINEMFKLYFHFLPSSLKKKKFSNKNGLKTLSESPQVSIFDLTFLRAMKEFIVKWRILLLNKGKVTWNWLKWVGCDRIPWDKIHHKFWITWTLKFWSRNFGSLMILTICERYQLQHFFYL